LVAVTSLLLSVSAARGQTIPLNLELDNTVVVAATVTVQNATIQNGRLTVTGSVAGTAVVLGTEANIPAQDITVTATAACKGGTGTLVLTTTQIGLNLADGVTATVGGQTLTVTASCGNMPTLNITTGPGQVNLSDGAIVSVSQCTVTVSSPAKTRIGARVCHIQGFICQLSDTTLAADAVNLLNEILQELQTLI
jgi:hypothetical protein